jgi:hypothetical protein
MKKLLILLALLVSPRIGSFEGTINNPTEPECKVFKQIIKNKPKVDVRIARQLANLIKKYAFLNEMDPLRAVAIAMQESGYKPIITKKNGKPFDIGIFQINVRTAKEFKLNTKKLMIDMEYSVKSYFIIMKQKKEICKRLKSDSWSCYHSRTPVFRIKYKKLVNRFYPVTSPKTVLNETKY